MSKTEESTEVQSSIGFLFHKKIDVECEKTDSFRRQQMYPISPQSNSESAIFSIKNGKMEQKMKRII